MGYRERQLEILNTQPVTVPAGQKQAFDARAFSKVAIYPVGGTGTVKTSVIHDLGASDHVFPAAPTSTTAGEAVEIVAAANFYLVEAEVTDAVVHLVP